MLSTNRLPTQKLQKSSSFHCYWGMWDTKKRNPETTPRVSILISKTVLEIKEDIRFDSRIDRSEYDRFRAFWREIEKANRVDVSERKGHERERELGGEGFMVRQHDWRTISTHFKSGTLRVCVVTQAIQSTFGVWLMRFQDAPKPKLWKRLVVSIYI